MEQCAYEDGMVTYTRCTHPVAREGATYCKAHADQERYYGCGESFQLAFTREDLSFGSGPSDDHIAYLLTLPHITYQLPDADDIRTELERIGAWDVDELADDEANRARIVWVQACDAREKLRARG